MRALAIAVAVLGACGSSPGPSPRVAPGPTPAPPPPPTCAEIGIIMRGEIVAVGADAGPEREKAIERSCVQDRWPQSVIDCAASTTATDDCLVHLTAMQRTAYDERLKAWATKWGVSTAAYAQAAQTASPSVDCKDALRNVELLDPELSDMVAEHEWQVEERQRLLIEDCETNLWTEDVKTCLRDATTAAAMTTCATNLAPTVHSTVLAISDVAKEISMLRKTPKKIGCAQVVEHHYGDAKWRGKIDDLTPSEQKQVKAAARKSLLDACTSWDTATRACVIADGSDELCFGGDAFPYPIVAPSAPVRKTQP